MRGRPARLLLLCSACGRMTGCAVRGSCNSRPALTRFPAILQGVVPKTPVFAVSSSLVPSENARSLNCLSFNSQADGTDAYDAVALANGLNANFLRSWVKAHRDQRGCGGPAQISADLRRSDGSANVSAPTWVPVTVQAADALLLGDIQIEIRHQQTVLQIAWPSSQASVCAQWLREVLR